MPLKLGFHGGKCCGIKVIHGFPYNYQMTGSVAINSGVLEDACVKLPPSNLDANGSSVSSDQSFFTDEAPKERTTKRLDRLIAFCEAKRPQGIIEVTLCESLGSSGYYSQVEKWAPKLLKRGFRLVNRCKNSNSGNTVHVFHKNSGE